MAKKTTILKNAMNQPYCGQTRFNYLDGEEVVAILHAMDEYAEQENEELKKQLAKIKEAAKVLSGIVKNSEGVTGWHLNGQILTWGEIELLDTLTNLQD